ncbi:hypothetical protein JCM1841_001709 [Sporobolomyces salmonicolor]
MAVQQKRPASARPASSTSSTPALTPSSAPGASAADSQAHDRLCLLLLVLVGQPVVATLKGGTKVRGILSAATTDGELSVALRQAVYLPSPSSTSSDSTPKASLLVNARDLHEIEASDIVLDPTAAGTGNGRPSSAAERDSFRTDTDISGLPPPNRLRERDLQAWSTAGAYTGGIEDEPGIGGLSLEETRTNGKGGGGWDQFAANERLYGLKSDYDDELYTTKLDRSGKDFKEREARAAQLEREILKGTSSLASNAHVAEERGEQLDDGDVNEEDRYGAVIRSAGAYVPPGARKAAIARLGGAPNGSAPSSAPGQPAAAPSTGSRLPPTSRIPATSSVPAPSSSSHPPVDAFRDFVRDERERLEKKKAALQQQAARNEKDSRLRSLVQWSQSFKNPYPITDEIATLMHGKKAAGTSTEASAAMKASSTTPSPTVSSRPLPPAGTAAPAAQSASPSPATQAHKPLPGGAKITTLLPEIPAFNPARAAQRQAELAAAKAGGPAVANAGGSAAVAADGPAAPAAAAAVTPPPPKPTSKISATAAPFVFKPNPNAASFTPGASLRKPSVPAAAAGTSPQPQPAQSAQPANPFFGTKPLKRGGSSSMHVKEDFTPFRLNAVLPDPGNVVPSWPFTGKPYRSMYPPSASPLSLADEQSAAAATFQSGAFEPSMSTSPAPPPGGPMGMPPPPQMQMHHHHPAGVAAPPPPPPQAAAAMGMPPYGMGVGVGMGMNLGGAMGAGGMGMAGMYGHPHQQGPPQFASPGGGPGSNQGGGPGGRFHPQHPHQHQHQQHPPPQMQMQFQPGPPLQHQHGPHVPPQAMGIGMGFPQGAGGGQGPHGGPMFTSPSMQPQQPVPPTGGGQQPGPPQQQRYVPYTPFVPPPPPGALSNGPPIPNAGPPPPPGSIPPSAPQMGFVPQGAQQAP